MYNALFSIQTAVPVVFVTGLYASGKSTLAIRIAEDGDGVYFSGDVLWKEWFYVESRRAELLEFFGEDVLGATGGPNIPLLQDLLFSRDNSKLLRARLLARYAGKFTLYFVNRVLSYLNENKDTKVIVIESDRLLQLHWNRVFSDSLVVGVHCPAQIRLERAIKRSLKQGRGECEEIHRSIMGAQISDSEMERLVGGVIGVHVSNIHPGNEYLKSATEILSLAL